MPRPIPGVRASLTAKKTQNLQPLESPEGQKEYAEKLKLAADLHAQGIDPTRWIAAQPADWGTQQAFQKTGQKGDRHFAVGNRLYKTSSKVAASQAQGRDALDVYLGADAKSVEQLVDITKVPLTHPTGRPHDTNKNRPDTHALNLHYARVGVDPASAHNGDPLPMESQPQLQQATRGPDGNEIPLGIPGIYRGYDDGYFYAANDGTRESAEVLALRRKLAAEKAQAQGDASAMVANDNAPDIDEAVARSYGATASKATAAQTAAPENRLTSLVSAIEKKQKGETLSAGESALLAEVETTFAQAGVPIDLKKADIDGLKRAAAAGVDQGIAVATKRPRTPVDAYVERVYGMSPDTPRATILPDPRDADGDWTWDVRQWKAPQVLYDFVRGFAAPSVAADGHPISDEETQNLALMMMGGGTMSARAVPHGGIGMPWATSGRVPRELAKTANEVVEFFYNPTPKELAKQLGQSSMKTLRAIRLKSGQVFTWPAEKSLHPDGIERLIAEGVITEADLVGAERLLYEDGVGYYAAP